MLQQVDYDCFGYSYGNFMMQRYNICLAEGKSVYDKYEARKLKDSSESCHKLPIRMYTRGVM